ncbi:hypothetical protein D3C78_1333200 [compost metagenome]
MEDFTKAVVVGLLSVVVIGALTVFSAFTLSTLWAWFIVPLGVSSIGLAHAYGVSLIASVLLGVRGIGDDASKNLIMGIILNLLALALAFGFVAVQFM